MPDPDWLSHPVTWASGFAGGIVSMFHSKDISLWQRLTTITVGTLSAGFLTPAISDYYHLSLNLVAALGFIIGMVGMLLTTAILTIANKAKDDPITIIKQIFGPKGDKS